MCVASQSVHRLCYELEGRGSIPDRGNVRNFSLHHRVQTGSGVHPASYPIPETGGSYPGCKKAGAWNRLLSSIQWRVYECMELYLHSSNTSSWCGAQL